MAVKRLFVVIAILQGCAAACSAGRSAPLAREAAVDNLRRLGLQCDQRSFVDSVSWSPRDIIDLYLDAGMDPNGQGDGGHTPLSAAAAHERDDIIKLLV